MKGYCGGCLEIRLAERSGRDVKWLRLMAVMKVDFMVLKAASWKYLASSRLVVP